jgi:hypothetical protein
MATRANESAWLILALVISFAGCMGATPSGGTANGAPDDASPDGPSDSNTTTGGVHVLRGSGCTYIYLETRTTLDKVEQYLPPGFSFPQPYSNTPLIIIDHHVCEATVIDNETEIPAFSQGRLMLWVTPPDDVAPPQDYLTAIQLQQWVNSESLLEIVSTQGAPSGLGSTAWDTSAENPLTFVASGEVSGSEGNEGWSFETLGDSERMLGTEIQRVYFVRGAGGDVAWYDEERQGHKNRRDYGGVLMPAPGSLLSEMTLDSYLVETTNDIGDSMEYHVRFGNA